MQPRYLAIWATSQDEEKAAFERFIDLVIERLDAHPEMHVYHYGGYESGAIKRLMQRHATCVDEVDRLLRGDVLVDLLNVVRQGVRPRVESYSLKQIEKFYMPAREGPVTEAGFSVVAFETLAQGTATRRSSTGSRPTTATTASRPGSSATGSRTAGPRRSRAGRSSTGTRPVADGTGAVGGAQRVAAGRRGASRGPDRGPRPDDDSPEAEASPPARRPPRLAPARREVAVVALLRAARTT